MLLYRSIAILYFLHAFLHFFRSAVHCYCCYYTAAYCYCCCFFKCYRYCCLLLLYCLLLLLSATTCCCCLLLLLLLLAATILLLLFIQLLLCPHWYHLITSLVVACDRGLVSVCFLFINNGFNNIFTCTHSCTDKRTKSCTCT